MTTASDAQNGEQPSAADSPPGTQHLLPVAMSTAALVTFWGPSAVHFVPVTMLGSALRVTTGYDVR